MSTTETILIVGGGVIGLSIALELRLRGAEVTVLSRDLQQAAGYAAAGMLAPQAEAIPPGPMLDLCLWSRSLYPGWINKLEAMTGLTAGYWGCGILAPVYDIPPSLDSDSRAAYWLDRHAIQHHEPSLSSEVMGGYWFPDDAQVDNRALMRSLFTAVQDSGVTVQDGETVVALLHQGDRVTGVQTDRSTWQADHYVLAAGAWSGDLLPVPVHPRKGQMLAVQAPTGKTLSLKQVLFGSEIYLVPRRDGRIIVGATSEAVGFTPGNTAAGVRSLLERAIRLYPVLETYPIQELWWGFRPITPDEAPILGFSPYQNLALATGHYRNGILLAPATALLIADMIFAGKTSPLLAHHCHTRFGFKEHEST